MRTLTITLDEDAAERLRRLIETGRYGDETQVVVAALLELEDGGTDIDDWLRNEVAAIYDADEAGEGETLTPEEVEAMLRRETAGDVGVA